MGFKTVALAFAGGIAAANFYRKACAAKALGDDGSAAGLGDNGDGTLASAFDRAGGAPSTESMYAADSVLGQPDPQPPAPLAAANATPSGADFPKSGGFAASTVGRGY